jgi:hypothetical protein
MFVFVGDTIRDERRACHECAAPRYERLRAVPAKRIPPKYLIFWMFGGALLNNGREFVPEARCSQPRREQIRKVWTMIKVQTGFALNTVCELSPCEKYIQGSSAMKATVLCKIDRIGTNTCANV